MLAEIVAFLNAEESAGRKFLPSAHLVLRALSMPITEVRVVILGQDPYPTPGHAVGLAFSVAPDVSPVPASLRNIFTELVDDVSVSMPTTGDLTPWTQQGILLLNRVLTVQAGHAGSHRGRGWEAVTLAIVRDLVRVSPGFVAILWGNSARGVAGELGNAPVLESAHPSPLSAHRGFFGSAPFSAVNRGLVERGWAPIDWELNDVGTEP